jgi:hypothetical protein
MLAGMVGIGIGMATAVGTGPQAAAAAVEPDDAVGRALFHLPDMPPQSRTSLARSLARTRQLFHEAQYAELGQTLPPLISGALAAGAHDVAARAYVLLAQLAIKAHQGHSLVFADRARTQAQLTGNPIIMGEADHSTAITMRQSGEYQAAINRLRGAANRLGDAPDQLALRGSLLLTAGYSAAQAGWRGQALDFMSEAEETAARHETGSQTLYIPGVFSMDQTAVFRISVHHALGEGDRALSYASKVDARRLPNAERRGRLCMDVARVWRDLGEPGRAFSALRALELHAPQEARRPKIRAITSELLAGNGEIAGLRAFAQRTGALV